MHRPVRWQEARVRAGGRQWDGDCARVYRSGPWGHGRRQAAIACV